MLLRFIHIRERGTGGCGNAGASERYGAPRVLPYPPSGAYSRSSPAAEITWPLPYIRTKGACKMSIHRDTAPLKERCLN